MKRESIAKTHLELAKILILELKNELRCFDPQHPNSVLQEEILRTHKMQLKLAKINNLLAMERARRQEEELNKKLRQTREVRATQHIQSSTSQSSTFPVFTLVKKQD